jgi:hypothetical protein
MNPTRNNGKADDAYTLTIDYKWSQDVDGRLTPPDESGHWFFINDRWTDWTLWRRLALERVA